MTPAAATAAGGPHAPDDELARDRLGRLGALLGRGGQAKVYEAPGLRLADVDRPLVYKEYRPGHPAMHGPRRLVALRNGTDPARQAQLATVTAWPVRQVVDNGAVCGLLLPRIPDPFFHEIRLPSGLRKRLPREVQFLFIPPDKAQMLDLPVPSPAQRIAICRDFAAALAFLHDDLQVVFGDVNARNALYRLDEEPMVMFVDCDAARRHGEVASVPQLNAPDWDPPEGGRVLSKSTDLYKLGLFVLRCLTPGAMSSVNRDPSKARCVLDPTGMALLQAAIGGPPDRRTTAHQWVRYLRRCLGEAVERPRLVTAVADRTIVPAGEPVAVAWTAEEADEIEVSGVGFPTVVVDGAGGSGTVVVHPARTSALRVVARNPLGEDALATPPVAVFDVAPVQWLPVGMPQLALPDLARTPLPEITSILPAVRVGAAPTLPSLAEAVGPWAAPGSAPSAPPWLDAGAAPPGFDEGLLHCPVDVSSIMTGTSPRGASTAAGATP